LTFPAVFLIGLVVYRRRSLGRAQLTNLSCGMLVVLLVAGWFYAACYRDILHYYSFWATTNQANVRAQYQLDSSWAGHLFYARNLVSQLGSVVLAISIAGLAGLTRVWRRASLLPPNIRLVLAWALCFVVGPYVILMARKSYASPADINMLPFLLLLALSGLWFSLGSMTARNFLAQTILLGALGLNLVSLARHHRTNLYQGIDPSRTTGQILDLLASHGYFKFQMYTLQQDIYFNAATVLNLALSDPRLRGRFDVSLPSYSLEERSSSKLSAERRYAALAEGADVLLVSERPKGMQWITINQQWQELHSRVMSDPRFVLLGRVGAYDDGTSLEVYGKETVLLETTGDGWLLNGAHLRVVAQPGIREIRIQGSPISERTKDLRLVCDDGEVWHGIPSGDDKWRIFDLRISLRT
ncbi:MAG: hypothetical protein L0312_24965, partial [Acidobacteria bacterium]|nr:hypothetical protein [Acidobacteriota bacterium]